ncbi:Uncharacterized protein Fot_15976 [Forsythia ovata]|uniref:Uncharacterized protein n=1 Tax=Forsythia ovata TaxID=205694 RepID=A0ABD1WD37_9LAMI
MPQLAPRFPSSDRTLLRTRSRLQSDCSIPNKIQPQVPTKIRTPTLPLEASLMLIVPPVELCPGGPESASLVVLKMGKRNDFKSPKHIASLCFGQAQKLYGPLQEKVRCHYIPKEKLTDG